MRLGETDRALAKTGSIGRRKLGEVRRVAEAAGWLDPTRPLPDDATLAERLHRPAVRSSSISLAEPFTRVCYYDPEVQRAYADCAEAYGAHCVRYAASASRSSSLISVGR